VVLAVVYVVFVLVFGAVVVTDVYKDRASPFSVFLLLVVFLIRIFHLLVLFLLFFTFKKIADLVGVDV